MPKLTYWIAECTGDHPCYSIIGKTRKAVRAEFDAKVAKGEIDPNDYDEVGKAEIEYSDVFDLFEQVTSEGAGRAYGVEMRY